MPAYAWTRTLPELQDMILRKLGVLGSGDSADAGDAAVVQEAIDARLKELHALGVLWWNVAGASTPLSLLAGVQTVAVAATDFLYPLALTVSVNTQEMPVSIIGKRQFDAIPGKADRGQPVQAFFDGATVYFYPVPDANYTANLSYQAQAADTDIAEDVDVPPGMLRSLASLVAGDLLDQFGIVGEMAARLMGQQDPAMRTIRALNAERVDSETIAPTWY